MTASRIRHWAPRTGQHAETSTAAAGLTQPGWDIGVKPATLYKMLHAKAFHAGSHNTPHSSLQLPAPPPQAWPPCHNAHLQPIWSQGSSFVCKQPFATEVLRLMT